MGLFALLKRPTGFLPMAMSSAAIFIIVLHIVRFGPAPQPDEGTSAHLWQLLMAAQVPVVALFAIKWLPQAPKQAVVVLVLQIVGIVAAMAPVALLGW
jgi:hypothetical protein